MKTVKEISKITGISVRTLHYYDEIGLLRPTEKSPAGYRLYDDKALETLQQILFFREFDLPLKQIKAVLDAPSLDADQTLRMQRRMLEEKRARLDRLIASIDDILKGENKMDFSVFSRPELEAMCQASIDHMPDFVREHIIQEFGSLDQWRAHYIQRTSQEDMQRGYQKMVEWYGDKSKSFQAMIDPPSAEVGRAYERRLEAIMEKLLAKRDEDVNSFPVKALIGEYGFVTRQFLQVKQEDGVMLSIAASYRDPKAKALFEAKFGPGTADFFIRAVEAFYQGASEADA